MHIVLAGSGKIASNIGISLLQKGHSVCWYAGSEQTRRKLESKVNKRTGTLHRRGLLEADTADVSFLLYTDVCRRQADLVIEATSEKLTKKKIVMQHVRRMYGDIPAVSTSSSILPSEIGFDVHGMHCFYPVDLIRCVEYIPCSGSREANQTLKTVESLGFHPVLQNEQTAFAANRILLPLQAEAIRLLKRGLGFRQVDSLSENALIAGGQLSLMRSIGSKLLCECIPRYCARMEPNERDDYDELLSVLRQEVSGGIGELLTEENAGTWHPDESGMEQIRQLFVALITLSCIREIDRGLDVAALDMLLSQVFGASASLNDVVDNIGAKNLQDVLKTGYESTSREYMNGWQKIKNMCKH
ncbi:MAG: 3-hydroxyacyl-CoA dehydrogenase NAD-binding domain-containing protein [Chitinispirillaceae bacterium]